MNETIATQNPTTSVTDTPALGRTPDIRDEDVFAAIDAMQKANQAVTGYSLKKRLGNKGNLDRYRKLIEQHKSSQSVTCAEPIHELPFELQTQFDQLSTALTQQLMQLAKLLNQRATTTAEQRVADAVKAARHEVEELQKELQSADTTNDELEQELDTLSEKLQSAQVEQAQQQKTIQLLEKQNQELAQALAVQQEREASSKQALTQLQTELLGLSEERNRLATQLSDAIDEKKSASKSAEKWQTKAETYEQERDSYLAERLSAMQDANSAKFKLGQLEQQIADLQREKSELMQLLMSKSTAFETAGENTEKK